jgi:hypothetical protein
MAFEDGPYVQAACFCEITIQETTGVLSLIRIIDTLTHTAVGVSPPAEMPPGPYPMKLVLMLKSGRARGRYDLKIIPELPSGETQEPRIMSVYFEGEEKGQNIVTTIQFTFTQEGLYWFNIYLDKDKLTAIPFRVKYSRMVAGPAST